MAASEVPGPLLNLRTNLPGGDSLELTELPQSSPSLRGRGSRKSEALLQWKALETIPKLIDDDWAEPQLHIMCYIFRLEAEFGAVW